MSAEREQLLSKITRRVKATSQAYGLIAPNDRIMVAVSGGKDSYTLLTVLERIRDRVPFSFELIAVHLDQKQPGYDGSGLLSYLEGSGLPFEILAEDTYQVVTEHIEEGGTYCSLCSRLRRGILYTAAERLGCNKIALGHHRDDALETFLMNLFYAGKLQAMPARYTTNDGRFEVIRPLIECGEEEIARYAKLAAYPIIPCNLCGSQPNLKRDQMSELMAQLETAHPNLRAVMLNAIKNVRPTHLLDPDLQAAWAARPEGIRPDPPHEAKEEHFEAAPAVVSSRPGRFKGLKVVS